MTPTGPGSDGFRFAYDPPTIRHGEGAARHLGDELAGLGLERALVVCGRTVGDTPAVVDPVTEGLGDRLVGVFAETTPEKRLGTALGGREAVERHGADCVVALGGGSSLDVAKAVATVARDDREEEAIGRAFAEQGTVVGERPPLPVVAVPTTLACAELSQVAGLTADPGTCPVGEPVDGGLSRPGLMPRAVVYDAALFATTPAAVLSASAMNGFDKGVETPYARNATPVTDATAVRGLGLLVDGLQALGREGPDPAVLDPVLRGIMLVQYGIGRPDGTTLSVIHAFGHGLTAHGTVQQGAAHAVVAPHVLRYLFERVDGRRELLARGLGVADAEDPAEAVVEAVASVRDALDLPERLRDVDGPSPSEYQAVAEYVLADPFMGNAPADLDPTVDDLIAVLEAAH